MPKRLLVVDGDPKTLRVLDVGLRQAGFDVHAVASASVALTLVEQITPDLIIVDPDNSSGPGLELIQRFVQRIGGKVPTPVIVMGKERGRDARLRAFDAGAADYVPKPPFVQEVVMRVNAVLQQSARERLAAADETSDARWSGALGNLGIVDLLQLLDETKQSGLVHLRRSRAGSATMYFRQGRLVDAEVGRLSGSDALYRLFSWPDGEFDFEAKSIRRKDAINQPTGQLLLEGLKQLDEWHRLVEQLPSLTAVFEVDYKLLAERLADIPDEVNGILRLFDGVRTVAQVIEDCALSDLEALTAITRLFAERIIYETKDDAVPRGSSSAAGLDVWLSDATAPFGIARERPRTEGGSDLLVVGTTALTGPPSDAIVKAVAAPGSGAIHSFVERLANEAIEPSADVEGAVAGVVPPEAPSSERPAASGNESSGSARARRGKRGLEASSRRSTHPGVGGGALGAAVEAEVGPGDDEIAPAIPDQATASPGSTASDDASSRDESSRVLESPAEGGDARASSAELESEVDPASVLLETVVPGEPPKRDNLIRFPGPNAASSREERDRDSVLSYSEVFEDEQTTSAEAASETTADLFVPDAAAVLTRSGATDEAPADERDDQDRAGNPTVLIASSPDVDSDGGSYETLQAERVGETVDPAAGSATATEAEDHQAPPPPPPAVAPSVLTTQRGIGPELAATATAGRDPEPVAESRAGGTVAPDRSSQPISPVEAAEELGLGSRRGTKVLLGVAAGVLAVFGGIAAWRLTRAVPTSNAETASVGAAAESTKQSDPTAVVAASPAPPVPPVQSAPVVDLPQADTRPAPGSTPSPPESRGRATAQAQRTGTDATTGTASAKPSTHPGREEAAVAPKESRLLDHCRAAFAGGRIRDARAACASAASADPKSAEAHVILAHAELNLGRSRQALDHARKAVNLDAGLADAYVIIGGVQQELGNEKEAKTAYLRYLELAPGGRYADDLRAIVQSL